MASFHRVHTGWKLRWRVGNQQRTRNYSQDLTLQQRADIIADKEYELRHDLATEVAARETVGGYALGWLNAPHEWAPYTVKAYEQHIRVRIVPIIGSVRLLDLRKEHVERLQQRVCALVSPKKAHDCMSLLRTILKSAWRDEKIAKNYGELVELPRVPKVERAHFDIAEIRTLLTHCSTPPFGPMTAVMVLAGLRPGEVGGLWTTDLNLDKRTLRVQRQAQPVRGLGMKIRDVPKTDAGRRVIVIPRALIPFVETQLTHRETQGFTTDGLLFATRSGKPISASKAWKGVKRVLASAGLEGIRPYALRHSYGSAALDQGANLKQVSVAMGHHDTRITERTYLHYEDDYTSEVADALDRGIQAPRDVT